MISFMRYYLIFFFIMLLFNYSSKVELEFLADFDVQTTLESFESQKQENKTGKKIPKLNKEPLQCLIGL
jgi:hypothetical protein